MSKGPKPPLLAGKWKAVVPKNVFSLLRWGLTPKEAVHRALVFAGHRQMPVVPLHTVPDEPANDQAKT